MGEGGRERCARQRNNVDRVVEAQETADTGGLAQQRRACGKWGSEATEAEEIGCWCSGDFGSPPEDRWEP